MQFIYLFVSVEIAIKTFVKLKTLKQLELNQGEKKIIIT